MKVTASGTLGDAYTIGLKLIKETEDIEILHYTQHKFWYKELFQIYSIFKNIKNVTFVEFMYPEDKEITGIPEEGMIWFPELELPYVPVCNKKYIVIQCHAGREDAMARKIPIKIIENMISLLHPIPVILVGTDKEYKKIECYLNLIGETSIIQATSIIIDSYGFCGPEGYCSFVALSHRIPSVIFWVRWQPVEARLLRNPWQEYIIDLIKI